MWNNDTTETTQIGYINRNNQEILGTHGKKGNDHGQYAYKDQCLENNCDFEYSANGSDLFQRKCPNCQGDKPGIDY